MEKSKVLRAISNKWAGKYNFNNSNRKMEEVKN